MTHQVVLAGCWGSGAQHHQRDMYLPALLNRPDTEIIGIWDAMNMPIDQRGRAAELGRQYDLPLLTDLAAAAAEADAVIACIGPNDVVRVLETCAAVETPVLLDKPTLMSTEQLRRLEPFADGVVAGHHVRFHPAVTAARAAVRSGQLGLLHAFHAELIVSDDGPNPAGELRNLVVYLLDVLSSMHGELSGRTFAVHSPPAGGAGDSWTISMHLDPDVVVSLLVARADSSVGPPVHRYRLLGSHGQLFLDLARPAMQLYGAQLSDVAFGPSSVELMLDAVLIGAPGAVAPTLSAAISLGHVLDAIQEAASTRRTQQFGGPLS